MVSFEVNGLMTFFDFVQGEPEYIINHSKYFLNEKGKPQPIDEFKKSELRGIVESFSSKGLRTLAMAYRDFTEVVTEWTEQHEVDLTCIAIFGIEVSICTFLIVCMRNSSS